MSQVFALEHEDVDVGFPKSLKQTSEQPVTENILKRVATSLFRNPLAGRSLNGICCEAMRHERRQTFVFRGGQDEVRGMRVDLLNGIFIAAQQGDECSGGVARQARHPASTL